MPSKRYKHFRLLSLVAVVVVCLGALGIGLQLSIASIARQDVARTLSGYLESTHSAFRFWLERELVAVEQLGLDNQLAHNVSKLLELKDDALLEERISRFNAIRERYNPLINAKRANNFYIIDSLGTVLVSSNLESIGLPHSILGASAAEKKLKDSQPFHLAAYDIQEQWGLHHVSYFVAPIFKQGLTLGHFLLEVETEKQLQAIFLSQAATSSLKALAFDRHGHILNLPGNKELHSYWSRHQDDALALQKQSSEPIVSSGSVIYQIMEKPEGRLLDPQSDAEESSSVVAWKWNKEAGVGFLVSWAAADAYKSLWRMGIYNGVFTFLAVFLVVSLALVYQNKGRQLDQLKQKFESVINNASSLIFMLDEQGMVILANRALCELVDRDEDSLIGKPILSLLHSNQYAGNSHFNSLNSWQIEIEEFEESFNVRGRGYNFHISKFPVYNDDRKVVGLGYIASDISENKRQHAEIVRIKNELEHVVNIQNADLKRERAKLSAIVDNAVDGIVMINSKGMIQTLNRAAYTMFGVENSEEILGKSIGILMGVSDQDGHDGYLSRAATEGMENAMIGRRREVLARKLDGTYFPVEIAISRLEFDEDIFFSGIIRDVSERKEKSDILKTIFDNSSDAYLLTGEQGILDCNRAAIQMLRAGDKRKLMDKQLTSFCVQDVKFEFSALKFKSYLNRAFKEGFQRVDWAFERLDGSMLYVDVSLTPVVHSNQKVLLVVWYDISERKLAEEAIRNNERKLRAVLDSTYQLLGMMLPDGTLIEANETALNLVDVNKEKVIGMKFWDTPWWAHSLDAQQQLKEGVLKARAGELVRYQTTHPLPNGEEAYIDFTLTPIKDEHGKVIMIIPEGHDITALKKAEQIATFARLEAEEANEAKSAFLANMIHEIRTPMNAIMGMTRLCLRTELTERQKNLLDGVDGASKVLLGILDDILDFSKIESGKLDIEKIAFDLNDVLSNVANVIALRADEKNIEFVINDNHVPNRLMGDPLRLQQVLTNLTSNAVKFTNSGEVVVSVKLLSRNGGQGYFRFSVQDTGIGLSEEQQSRLFESFTQADVSTTRKYGGTGLGLAISKQLVELMSGRIGVHSKSEKGSDFFFDLPLDIISEFDHVSAAERESLGKYRVLIVDDNEVCRTIEEKIISSFGYQHKSVASGEEALAVLCDAREPFDVVLMDWDMPGTDGLEASRKIREQLKSKAPAIVLVTGVSNEKIYDEAGSFGIDGFVVKPVNRDVLQHVVLKSLDTIAKREKVWPPLTDRKPSMDGDVVEQVTLLVVEDNDINQFVIKESLEHLGYVVTLANNGQEAVEKVKSQHFDAVLMDLQMPVMDGFRATEIIREEFGKSKLPIIAMTANVLQKHQARCIEVGMNDHLSKPIQGEVLQEVLSRWVQQPLQARKEKSVNDVQSVSFSIPGIDVAFGLRQFRQNKAHFVEMLIKFRRDFGGVIEEIDKSIEHYDSEEAQSLAHRLKGVSGNLGLFELSDVAAKIENEIEATGRIKHIDELVGALEQVEIGICQLIQGTDMDESFQEKANDKEFMQALLVTVAERLTNHEVLDRDVVSDLKSTLYEWVSAEEADRLLLMIDNFQYKKATEMMADIMQQLV